MVAGITKVFYFGTLAVRIGNFGVDSYMLVESINRAATGKPCFDDEYKRLAEDVVKEGQKYEAKAVELEMANAELNNLYDVFTILGNITEAYEAKIEAWNKRIIYLEKLFDDLQKHLGERFYLTWFLPSFISRATHSQVPSEEIKKRLAQSNGAGWITVRIVLSSVALGTNVYCFYDMYKDWKAWRAGGHQAQRPRRMAIFRRPAMGRWARVRGIVRGFYSRYKYHIAFFASSAFLALTITMLTIELDQLKDAKAEMRKQINSYKRFTEGFDIVLKGTTSNPTDDQIKLLTEILNPEGQKTIDFSQDKDKEAVKLGFRGIVNSYEKELQNILSEINEVYTGAIDFLSDTTFLQEEIYEEQNEQKQKRENLLANFKGASKEFEAKKTEQQELQKEGKTADRKNKIVEIANSFKTRVLEQLDSAISTVDSHINLLNMYNSVITVVETWLDLAEDVEIVETEKPFTMPPKIKQRVIKLLNDNYPQRTQLKDEDSISQYLKDLLPPFWKKTQMDLMEKIIIEPVKSWIENVIQIPSITDDMKKQITELLNRKYPKRTQLQDEASISEYLKELVERLCKKKQMDLIEKIIVEPVKTWVDKRKEIPSITDDMKKQITELLDQKYPVRTELKDEASISEYLRDLVAILWFEQKNSESTS